MLRRALWIGKRLCSAELENFPDRVRCSESVETLEHIFFDCRVVCPLCKFIEDVIVRMLREKFFPLVTTSVCSIVVLSLTKAEHKVLF